MSCEGNTRRELIIQNMSTDTISIVYEDVYEQAGTEILNSMNTSTIYLRDTRGGQSGAGSPSNLLVSLLILQGQDTCTKDYLTDLNWMIESEHVKKAPSQWVHEFTFVVNDSDF
jgi:hypothetical protein